LIDDYPLPQNSVEGYAHALIAHPPVEMPAFLFLDRLKMWLRRQHHLWWTLFRRLFRKLLNLLNLKYIKLKITKAYTIIIILIIVIAVIIIIYYWKTWHEVIPRYIILCKICFNFIRYDSLTFESGVSIGRAGIAMRSTRGIARGILCSFISMFIGTLFVRSAILRTSEIRFFFFYFLLFSYHYAPLL